jgi:hypothetical protein
MQARHILPPLLTFAIDATIELYSALPTRYPVAMQPSMATQQSASVVQAAGRVGVMMAASASDRAPASGGVAGQSDPSVDATFADLL